MRAIWLVLLFASTACVGRAPVEPRATVRVAMCQIEVTADPERNLRAIERGIAQAAARNADIALFPEACVYGWVNGAAHDGATPIPGATSERLGRAACTHGIAVACGIAERDGNRLCNSVVLIDRDGQLVGRHRKVNVLPELMEPPYSPGGHARDSVFELPFARVGLLICADTFRDDLVAEVAAAAPDLVLVPYGWAAPAEAWPDHGRSLASWVSHTAKRLGCPVVGVDSVGRILDGPWRDQVLGGQSPACGADGRCLVVLADRSPDLRLVELALR